MWSSIFLFCCGVKHWILQRQSTLLVPERFWHMFNCHPSQILFTENQVMLTSWVINFFYFFFTVPFSIPHFCLYIQWGIAFLTVLSVYKIVLQSGRIDGCSSFARLKWFYLIYYFIVVFESSRGTNQTGLKRCPGISSRLNFIVLPTSFFVLSERPLVDKAPAGTKDYSCCTFLFIYFLSNI